MKIVDLGCVEYERVDAILESFVLKAKEEDYLIFCTHPPVYTIGSETYETDLKVVKTDRGGSITYFDEGCLLCYFAFKVKNPPFFYKKVVRSFENFFHHFSQKMYYDKKRPGFYIENKKIASLGFRYKEGVSKHGVSLHIDPDLEAFNKIRPCGLEGVEATSLAKEGYKVSMQEVKKLVAKAVRDVFEA